MSFLKITDPKKRDFRVNECLKTRQSIQQNFLSERVGDLNTQYELTKLFKPVMYMQKASKSWKWKHILKPIWDENDLYTGNGITPSDPTIILPCDPIALVEGLDIPMASKAAGSTGVRNEFVSVCDELLRQRLTDKHIYKIIMLQL